MRDNKKIPLVEKFGPTIQGEGAVIGQQTYFLRFGLCDYRCTMCDSMHAVEPAQVKKNAKWLTQDEIAALFNDHDTNDPDWITFSGGNPCIHDLTLLCTTLKDRRYRIAVETQGTLYPDWLWQCDVVTVSPKSPGMGEKFDQVAFLDFLRGLSGHKGLNCKVVVFSEEDLKFADTVAKIWYDEGHNLDDFYLSQGNPFPPGRSPRAPVNHLEVLRREYLGLLEKLQAPNHPYVLLPHVKFLPQFHVWLWSNKQGV